MADRLLGSFVWCELLTTDSAAAQDFYKKVVGWKSAPFAPDGSYSVFNNSSGAGVAGVMTLPSQTGAPPHWLMYIGTPSVDDTVVRVAQLGGRVLKQPDDIPNTGRFAIVQDPYGATFGIYTPQNPGTGKGDPDVGDFSWFELYTPNPERAWAFYEKLFGWEKTTAMDMGDMGTYQMFGRGRGIPSGGIMKPPPGAPPAWQPYALVKDAKAAAAAATANGGKIVNGPMEVPGGDWIAVGMDPQGAMFAVHSLNPGTTQQAEPARPASKKKAASTSAKAKGTSKKTAKPATKRFQNPAQKKKAKAKSAKTMKRKPVKKAAAGKSAKKSTKKTAKKAAKRKK